jgi:hypothetical protein
LPSRVAAEFLIGLCGEVDCPRDARIFVVSFLHPASLHGRAPFLAGGPQSLAQRPARSLQLSPSRPHPQGKKDNDGGHLPKNAAKPSKFRGGPIQALLNGPG